MQAVGFLSFALVPQLISLSSDFRAQEEKGELRFLLEGRTISGRRPSLTSLTDRERKKNESEEKERRQGWTSWARAG